AGNLGNIQGNLTIFAGAGLDSITFDDLNNPTTGGLTLYTLGGTPANPTLQRDSSGLITYQGFNAGITLNAGNGSNLFSVNSTSFFTTTINGGNSADVFIVRATSGPLSINPLSGENTITIGSGGSPPFSTSTLNRIQGAVTVNGVPRRPNTLTVNDQPSAPNSARSHSLTGVGFNGLQLTRVDPTAATGPISLSSVNAFTLNASGNVSVLSTPFGTSTTVNAWVFNNTVLVGGGLPGDLGGIIGPLTANGQVAGT